MNSDNIKALILVDAAGIKPERGDISEIFMVSGETRIKQRFYDPSQVPNYEAYTRDLTDEEKLEAFADILLENIKLKKQIADLKAKK